MTINLAGTDPAIFENDARTPVPFARKRDVRDPIGLWYAVRKRYGQDDRMWFALYRNGRPTPQWNTCSHRFADGLGAFPLLLRERGLPEQQPPASRPMPMPGWRTLWRERKDLPGPAIRIKWKFLEPAASTCVSHVPVSVLLSETQTADIEQVAAAMGVSSTVWLLWTADRALRATLAEPESVTGWVFPVNMRGSVRNVDAYANHCSGLFLRLEESTDAQACKRQIRERFERHEHWKQWLMLSAGKWLGLAGIRLVHRLIQGAPGRFAGSYSNLGEWNVPGLDGAVAVAPGSPAYPVSAATMLCNGRRVMACRLHPVIGGDARRAIEFLKVWRELSLKPLVKPVHQPRETAVA
ncbi:MAG: hypothetical protein K0R03_1247 [Moraxellaceae bacterium]|jgi:hypothetical protein|nr:hypothetical protein [Moraxellaceae bacterium]